jgi:hypothetical protein
MEKINQKEDIFKKVLKKESALFEKGSQPKTSTSQPVNQSTLGSYPFPKGDKDDNYFNIEIDINKFIGLNNEDYDILERLYKEPTEIPNINNNDYDYFLNLPTHDNYKPKKEVNLNEKIISNNDNSNEPDSKK